MEIETGLSGCSDPAMVEAGGRSLLAFTALPPGGLWRQAYVVDVTDRR